MGTEAALVSLLLGLLDRATTIGALLSKTRAEGRQPSPEELDELFAADQVKRDALDAEIARQRGAA
jgi:hypothetical protein